MRVQVGEGGICKLGCHPCPFCCNFFHTLTTSFDPPLEQLSDRPAFSFTPHLGKIRYPVGARRQHASVGYSGQYQFMT